MKRIMYCRRCGTMEQVHRNLCRECRARVAARTPAPPEPWLEPPHDRPWGARSAFVGRTRRSPRG